MADRNLKMDDDLRKDLACRYILFRMIEEDE